MGYWIPQDRSVSRTGRTVQLLPDDRDTFDGFAANRLQFKDIVNILLTDFCYNASNDLFAEFFEVSAIAHDNRLMLGKQNANISAKLAQSSRSSGRNPFSIAIDYFRLSKKPGKLRLYEYLLYELYDRNRWSDSDREKFVSAHIHWPIVNACNNPQWWAVTEDKWLSSCLLQNNGLPTPQNLAVYDGSARYFGKTPKLTSAADLKSFLSKTLPLPIFAKPINGMWSAGAIRISSCSETHVTLDGQEPVSFSELAETTFGNTPYILQNCLMPSEFFQGITDSIATVRCLNLIDKGQLSVPYTILKLPQNGNIADNFWRSGNLVCNLDPQSGKIMGIVSIIDGRRVELDALPGSGRTIIGETLPFWEELRLLNEKVALLHAENQFGSTDIALTADGPVVVEVNNGCAFELMQIATGRGFLDEQMKRFFRDRGVKI